MLWVTLELLPLCNMTSLSQGVRGMDYYGNICFSAQIIQDLVVMLLNPDHWPQHTCKCLVSVLFPPQPQFEKPQNIIRHFITHEVGPSLYSYIS